uniref:Uncharacterized protein n=1 Tax=Myotis myotis TaxID=51298 RepID=A0A7J7RGY2_MYOMY|nr:hypothetical protein mMyoMyo1_010308 [Myotis myotis]
MVFWKKGPTLGAPKSGAPGPRNWVHARVTPNRLTGSVAFSGHAHGEGRLSKAPGWGDGARRWGLFSSPWQHHPPPQPRREALLASATESSTLPSCQRRLTRNELGRQGLQDALVPGPEADTQVGQQLGHLGPPLPGSRPRGSLGARGFPGEWKELGRCQGHTRAQTGPVTDAYMGHGDRGHDSHTHPPMTGGQQPLDTAGLGSAQ